MQPFPAHTRPSLLALAVMSAAVQACSPRVFVVAAPYTAAPMVSFETTEGTGLSFDVSPDGDEVVFDLLGGIWTLPAAGGAARPLTHPVRDTSHDADPSFSPDGRWILFRSDRPAGHGLWLMSAEGGVPRLITPGADADGGMLRGSWSPDGRSVVYVLHDTMRITDVETGATGLVQVQGLPAPPVRDPVFSADGSAIVFVNASVWARNGGTLWEVPAAGGEARRLLPEAVRGFAPAPAPDGAGLAWIARDASGAAHVFVSRPGEPTPRQVTEHTDLAPFRVRWSSARAELVYAADGGLHRVRSDGGAPVSIPFTARVELPRVAAATRVIRTPDPGSERPARGFMGLAIAPDGGSYALIALGRLWHVPVDGEPRPVRGVPATAAGLSWSPDGTEVVWSAGPGGGEDLFVTDVRNGTTRQLTALAGREDRATWSPDGRHIAFLHWHPAPADSAPWLRQGWEVRIRVVPAAADRVASPGGTADLGAVPGFTWSFSSLAALGQEKPQWAPGSDAVLRFGAAQADSTAVLLPLAGSGPRTIPGFPAQAAFVEWGSDSTLVFVRENQLWRVTLDPAGGVIGDAVRIGDDAALYPTRARDGTLLYLSSDGLRLRSPDGTTRVLGWPLRFRTAAAAPPLLLRNARIIDGTGALPDGLSDVLLQDGRIAQIMRAGSASAPSAAQIVDIAGRTLIPGLIDLHAHLWDDAILPGWLAYGVTTGREMGSAIARAAGFRDAVDAGSVQGMRLVLGGFQFNPVPDDGVFSGAVIQQTSGRERAERALALAEALGADYVKMRIPATVSSGVALVAAARARGMRISSHCAISLPLIAAGLNGKEHLGASCEDRFDERLYGDVAALLRSTGVWVVPTITGFSSVPLVQADSTLLGSSEPYHPATGFQWWWMLRLPPAAGATYSRFAADARAATGALHRAGVTLGAGADIGAPGTALHMELEELVRSGLSPLEALAAATGNAARILGAADIGTIRVGNRADLVVLDGDPLADIRNTRRIHSVIQAGRIIERSPTAPPEPPTRGPR